MRRTKIVATLGPATASAEGIRSLVEAGVDLLRLNFSHGTRETHRETIHLIREACAATGREVGILQDLCGPKIRVGRMPEEGAELATGSDVTITTRALRGSATRFHSSYKALPRDVEPEARILLDDGAIELSVLSVTQTEVRCRVVRGGLLKSRKGMNLPDTSVSAPSLTPKDLRDLAVGLEEGVDFVALSFVRHPDDIRRIRRAVERKGGDVGIIAKIEKPEAIQHMDGILEEADGIMVARGDLGVEMALEGVPLLQKQMIRRANESDKIVITATQMLESMVRAARPTRAEVADVANAIFDGTDALMLSGETAVGDHPQEAVRVMDRIARRTEGYLAEHAPAWDWPRVNPVHPLMDALGHAALRIHEDLDLAGIAAFSASGATALFLSKSRPFAPILVFTSRRETLRRMRPLWGVEPILDGALATREDLRERAAQALRTRGARPRDNFLLVAGRHFGQVGQTNLLEIARVSAEDSEAPPPRSAAQSRRRPAVSG